jgi:hypothetical protein
MSVVEEIDGRRIAKDVEARARALRTLDRTRTNRWTWRIGAATNVVFFAAMGAAARKDSWWVGIIAGAGYALGVVAFFEVTVLRRRLEAVITLLRQGQHPPE